jgi:hypothetical protein
MPKLQDLAPKRCRQIGSQWMCVEEQMKSVSKTTMKSDRHTDRVHPIRAKAGIVVFPTRYGLPELLLAC